MTGDRRYVYGVIEDESLDLDVDAVGDASTVTTVAHRKHAAVVSDIDTMEPEQSDENVKRHNEVLRAVMNHGDGRTVVPMRFGMVFKNDRALKNVLRNGRRAFTKALQETEGMVELGVKVVAPAEGSPDPEGIQETVDAELDPPSVEATEDERFSDRLLLNRSYLVERADRPAFDDAVDRVEDTHEDVTVQYTGPWPPYSFVDIEIGVEG